ncbi:MAG: hypothetical protein OZ934_14370 [Anaerolineae bacterium]|nr:hypothetical protein [Anaerolineae bacterium]
MSVPDDIELRACIPVPVNPHRLNPDCVLPYDLEPEHVHRAMGDFIDFLGFINQQLHTKGMPRLESFL